MVNKDVFSQICAVSNRRMLQVMCILVLFIITALPILCGCSTSSPSITKLEMYDTKDVILRSSNSKTESWVKTEPKKFDDTQIKFVSADESIATISAGKSTSGALWYEINPIQAGETTVYATTIDGSVKSDEIKVYVYLDESDYVDKEGLLVFKELQGSGYIVTAEFSMDELTDTNGSATDLFEALNPDIEADRVSVDAFAVDKIQQDKNNVKLIIKLH